MKELSNGLDETDIDENASDDENDATFFQHLSSKAENTLLVIVCILQVVVLGFFWLLTLLILWLLYRYTRLKRYIPRKKLSIISILLGTIVYFLVFGFSLYGDEYINMSVEHINTFLWLLIAISGSLLLRVKPDQFRQGFLLFSATILIALVIIVCRVTFMPDKMMVLLFPPILLLTVVWQLLCPGLYLCGFAHSGVVVFPVGSLADSSLHPGPDESIQTALAGQASGQHA